MINNAQAKLNNVRQLSSEQETVIDELFELVKKHVSDDKPYVVWLDGDAGTGKSVVLTELFKKIQQENRTQKDSVLHQTINYLTVNHAEMIKVYKEIAGKEQHLYKKDIQKPTPLINRLQKQNKKSDVVLVDEGHLLLTQPDRYNKFNQVNQLTELINQSRVVIVVFDAHQFLKTKSFWTTKTLQSILNNYHHKKISLTEQFRLKAPLEVYRWIDSFAKNRQLLPYPDSGNYDFRLYTDLAEMYQDLKRKDQEYGLSRLISTADYPYKMDGQLYYVEEPGFKLPWDHDIDPNLPWAQRPETINEVGSIYTIQGFDLNYAGVILGPGITYDEKQQQIVPKPEYYQDFEAFKKRSDEVSNESLATIKMQIMMNAVNVLLKRGVHGLFIYASNPELKAAFEAINCHNHRQ
ncbi:DUF2075 domain-containing protein [Holzapfeliella sp. JNUCC 72]